MSVLVPQQLPDFQKKKRNSSVVFLAVFSEYSSAGPLSESSEASHTGEMENKRSKGSIIYFVQYEQNKQFIVVLAKSYDDTVNPSVNNC